VGVCIKSLGVIYFSKLLTGPHMDGWLYISRLSSEAFKNIWNFTIMCTFQCWV